MNTALGDNLRNLAKARPNHAFELKRHADLFDEAAHDYFEAEPQTMTAKQFMSVWSKARSLHDDLSVTAEAA